MSQKLAEERIRILFEEAEKRPQYAERYLKLAEKIGMRTEISIPRDLEKKYCSECYTVLRPGDNCKVRINSKNKIVEYKCLECGNTARHGYQ
ncbi:ribonuclease P protein component 4 [Candidatus Haloredivivus sp. G17]|nr:ribonuclease P protein component 4 [Candidatus Haloredivivus sp. G17]